MKFVPGVLIEKALRQVGRSYECSKKDHVKSQWDFVAPFSGEKGSRRVLVICGGYVSSSQLQY
jgi:hypothetical protein